MFIKSTLYSSYIDVLSVRFYWKNSNLLAYVFSSTSSRPEVFCEKAVLRNLLKFTGKHICQSFFFNKVPGLGLQLYHFFTQSTSGGCFCSSYIFPFKFNFCLPKDVSTKSDLLSQNYVGWKIKVLPIKELNVSNNMANKSRYQ